ncbi:MAG: hypothetical protein FWE24_04315 [Defluviitaleaceae bacterium]|nr:hypothetical protein [Defluviitaleaceae bacterium]
MKQLKKTFVRQAFLENDTKRTLTAAMLGTRGKSAIFWKVDCFECLSLRKSSA